MAFVTFGTGLSFGNKVLWIRLIAQVA